MHKQTTVRTHMGKQYRGLHCLRSLSMMLASHAQTCNTEPGLVDAGALLFHAGNCCIAVSTQGKPTGYSPVVADHKERPEPAQNITCTEVPAVRRCAVLDITQPPSRRLCHAKHSIQDGTLRSQGRIACSWQLSNCLTSRCTNLKRHKLSPVLLLTWCLGRTSTEAKPTCSRHSINTAHG
jgi:hypothetical protein